ncbi:MAG: DUF2330 domain-containing protein [Phycisphaerae bacterium]|nr:DUF2330 domain-containing protein [Phycisphaerae bacterium]NIT57606.1 DUF2330 domain-containing protein [Fodinibius sp.]NIS52834.1 DUF2330 domain-containing protein [Phycisphaerae bacterium]NIU58001.1 DUF2330 domain-containing protein [Phycisphaerae bacterium]NIV12509.1 DUF2330 domain-containing protein [Fodinibius sp.]
MEKRESPSCLFMILWVSFTYLTTLSPGIAYADGKFYPERAYKVAPAIPGQRAIIVYKNGIEKLIIESALDGEGREFGWIIPLPSKPTEFEKVSPGFIKTLSLTVQPKITHDLSMSLEVFNIIAASIGLWCLLVLATKPKRLHVTSLFLFGCLFIALSVLGPALNKAGERAGRLDYGEIPGVKIHDIQEIGSYELAVLEADNSRTLDTWLQSNGFAHLTEKDEAIISDYISNGWYFVAAKLRRETAGYSKPHPLAMTFPSDKAIYPIRLTATVGSEVYLELFVIADKQARCKGLALELSDQYHFLEKALSNPVSKKRSAGFIGKTHHQNIGHPITAKYMWDGCVLSKLCGTLKPGQMNEDIVLQLRTGKPYQKHYYSHRGAKEAGLLVCLVVWCILLLALTTIFYGEIKKENGKKFYLSRIIIPAVLLSLLLWALTYAALPKVQVHTRTYWRMRYEYERRALAKQREVAREYNYFKGVTLDGIVETIDGFFRYQVSRNTYTPERIKREDSPGNYTIFKDDRGVIFRTYFRGGVFGEFVLTTKSEDPRIKSDESNAIRAWSKLMKLADENSGDDVIEVLSGSVQHVYQKSTGNWIRVPTRLWLPHYRHNLILIRLYKEKPKKLVPIVLADLKNRLRNFPEHIKEIEYELSMLGCITRTIPPLDVTDKKKINEFIKEIEAWCNLN